MSVLSDYIAAIDQLVPGTIPLVSSDEELAIDMALMAYSKHRPRIVVEDVTGDGGFDYTLADLAAWSDGFSVIRTVEYPVDDDDETPDILQDDDWVVYAKPAGDVLRFLTGSPLATETFRVTYTAIHAFTATACTVKAFDEKAVQSLASAIFCEMLATYFAQNQDSTISADSVDQRSKASEYAARAKAYRKLYTDHIGIKDGQVPAASVTKDQDATPSWQGDGLTHPRRYR